MTDADPRKNWVPFPRYIFTDRKSGAITRNEYELYTFIRHSANPYGTASVSLEGLLSDFNHHDWKSKNYVNKLLLSLKRKRYIHYDDRSGRKGSFDIHLPEFFTPTGGTTCLPNDVSTPKEEKLVSTQTITKSEVRQSFTPVSPRLDVKKDGEIRSIGEVLLSKGRGSYTDTNTNEEKDRSLKRDSKVAPGQFRPDTFEEGECQKIALELGEENMDYLLGTMHKHNFGVIERAWGIYRHDVPNKGEILNKPAYFNTIVSNLLEEEAPKKA